MIDRVTPYGLRQYAAALFLPSRERVRWLLYGSASEIDGLAAANANLLRANDALARELTDWVHDSTTASAVIERLEAENAALRARNAALAREVEQGRQAIHRETSP